MPELSLTLPAVPDSIPVARQTLERLGDGLDGWLLEDVSLLVSEIVTNGVRHGYGGRTVDLRVVLDPLRVRIEVENHGPRFETDGTPTPPRRDRGWGLLLVDRLADRWGVISNRTTTVWFELDRTRRARAAG